MSAVAQADSTLAYMRAKIRKLTASSSESSLRTSDIDTYINNFYNQNFPNSIKTDQMRSVYTFYTAPYIDRYPVNVNYNQGFRSPVYVDGIQGSFFKDRQEFFRMWPRWPTLFQPISGNGTQQQFSFSVGSTPFLRNEVTLGGTDTTGAPIRCSDDGNGNMVLDTPNPQISVPAANAVYTSPPLPDGDPLIDTPVPGMKNLNTRNPGQLARANIGTVNYITGSFSIDFTSVGIIPAAGQLMNLYVSQYTTGRPYSLMFWNNEITIRPVPKFIHKIEVEAYLTPVQFMLTTDSPIINQWMKYICYGTAIDILTDRQDLAGVENLMPAFKYEEGLVLERQGTEELFQRNSTIFSATVQGQGNYWGSWGWF